MRRYHVASESDRSKRMARRRLQHRVPDDGPADLSSVLELPQQHLADMIKLSASEPMGTLRDELQCVACDTVVLTSAYSGLCTLE
eukprot:9503996-Pyramimonas_sp.AAC.2